MGRFSQCHCPPPPPLHTHTTCPMQPSLAGPRRPVQVMQLEAATPRGIHPVLTASGLTREGPFQPDYGSPVPQREKAEGGQRAQHGGGPADSNHI